MNSPQLRKANSSRSWLHDFHPFRSSSTSRLLPRVEPSHATSNTTSIKSSKAKGSFLSQLTRSFTVSRSDGKDSGAIMSKHDDNRAGLVGPKPAASISHVGKASKESRVMRRVKDGLVRPLKCVRDSYVDCMMAVAEDPRFDGMVAVGFHGPGYGVMNHSNVLSSGSLRASSSSSSELLEQMDFSEEHLRAALRKSKHFGEAIPE